MLISTKPIQTLAIHCITLPIEGPQRGGTEPGDGTSLYALAKEVCSQFGTCEGSGDASINEFLMESFADGRDLIRAKDCDGAAAILSKEIISNSFQLASASIISQSILPLVNAVNATSATTISSNLAFDLSKKPVQDGTDAVYNAVTFALPGMRIDCDDIGLYKGKSACPSVQVFPGPGGPEDDNEILNDDKNFDGGIPIPINPDVRPVTVVDTPTNLGQGLYTTTTYVADRANIAKDVVAIKDALESGSNVGDCDKKEIASLKTAVESLVKVKEAAGAEGDEQMTMPNKQLEELGFIYAWRAFSFRSFNNHRSLFLFSLQHMPFCGL